MSKEVMETKAWCVPGALKGDECGLALPARVQLQGHPQLLQLPECGLQYLVLLRLVRLRALLPSLELGRPGGRSLLRGQAVSPRGGSSPYSVFLTLSLFLSQGGLKATVHLALQTDRAMESATLKSLQQKIGHLAPPQRVMRVQRQQTVSGSETGQSEGLQRPSGQASHLHLKALNKF